MGQAKNRGTFEERRAAAIIRNEAAAQKREFDRQAKARRALDMKHVAVLGAMMGSSYTFTQPTSVGRSTFEDLP